MISGVCPVCKKRVAVDLNYFREYRIKFHGATKKRGYVECPGSGAKADASRAMVT